MLQVRQQIGGLGNLMFKQAYLYAQMRQGIIPDVYVQGERYFKEFGEEIKHMFGEGIGNTPMVSLHIRRGDYLDKNNFYIDLTQTDYYKKAIEVFNKETVFLVFYKDRQDKERDKEDEIFAYKFMSDLVGDRFILWNGEGDETDDLNKMASCLGHIMANSSFSWWASYLGHGESVCPKLWFTDGVQRCGLLDKWIKI